MGVSLARWSARTKADPMTPPTLREPQRARFISDPMVHYPKQAAHIPGATTQPMCTHTLPSQGGTKLLPTSNIEAMCHRGASPRDKYPVKYPLRPCVQSARAASGGPACPNECGSGQVAASPARDPVSQTCTPVNEVSATTLDDQSRPACLHCSPAVRNRRSQV